MRKLILALQKTYVFILFVILEVFAINYYANSNSFTRARIISAGNSIAGGTYGQISKIDDYIGIRKENNALHEQLAKLNNELIYYKSQMPNESLLVREFEGSEHILEYLYTPATVINNSIARPDNFLTLDKGRLDGVAPNMAVITPEGSIVGYIIDCSDRFSVAISVLNTEFRTGGKIKGKDFFGSVYWDGLDDRIVTLTEIPKYAELKPGDTIITDYSSIFPPDVVIGTVEEFELRHSTYFDVTVRLSTNVKAVRKVFIVSYADVMERMLLEDGVRSGR